MPDIPVDTHVSRVGTRLGAVPPGRAVRGAARRHARAHPARPGAGVPRQPAAPRPPHLPRAAAATARVRAEPDVPVGAIVVTLPRAHGSRRDPARARQRGDRARRPARRRGQPPLLRGRRRRATRGSTSVGRDDAAWWQRAGSATSRSTRTSAARPDGGYELSAPGAPFEELATSSCPRSTAAAGRRAARARAAPRLRARRPRVAPHLLARRPARAPQLPRRGAWSRIAWTR